MPGDETQYAVKLYVTAASPASLTSLGAEIHELLDRHGARLVGSLFQRDCADGWGYLAFRFVASSVAGAYRIFDEGAEKAAAREDVILTGVAYGTIDGGWEVWNARDDNPNREELFDLLRQVAPAGSRGQRRRRRRALHVRASALRRWRTAGSPWFAR